MSVAKPLLVLFAVVTAGPLTSSADACDRYSRVTYRVTSTPTRVLRTTHVSYRPATVVEPVTTVVSQVKKIEVVKARRKASPAPLEVGATVTARVNFLGAEQGYVFMQFGGASLQCEIQQWSAGAVTFKVPNLGLREPTKARLEVVRPDGETVRGFVVDLTPRVDLFVHEEQAPEIDLTADKGVLLSGPAPVVIPSTGPAASVTATIPQ